MQKRQLAGGFTWKGQCAVTPVMSPQGARELVHSQPAETTLPTGIADGRPPVTMVSENPQTTQERTSQASTAKPEATKARDHGCQRDGLSPAHPPFHLQEPEEA